MPDDSLDTERILQSANTVDSARLTLRWALERIRHLETSHAEVLDLLKTAQAAREKAVADHDGARKSLDERMQAVAKKERFVAELEAMLKNVFNGIVDPQELIRRREELERIEAQLEARTQEQLQAAEERHLKEIENQARKTTEMEAAYSKALNEAQARYEAEVREFQRQRQDEALTQSAKESRFREELAEQLARQADQYHQKLMLLQLDYAQRRKDLQKEFDQLKDRLFEETRHVESRQAFAVRVAEARWAQERERLARELSARESEIARLGKEIEELRQSSHERENARIREFEAAMDALLQSKRGLEVRLDAEIDRRVGLREELVARHEEAGKLLEARLRSELEARRDAVEEELRRRQQALDAAEGETAARHRTNLQALRGRLEAELADELEKRLQEREQQMLNQQKALEALEQSLLERESLLIRGTSERMEELDGRRCREIDALKAENERQRAGHEAAMQEARLRAKRLQEFADEAVRREREMDRQRQLFLNIQRDAASGGRSRRLFLLGSALCAAAAAAAILKLAF